MSLDRVLVLHGGTLGDCVLTLHVARWVGLSRGGRVCVAARSSIGRWAQRRGLIDESVSLDEIGANLWHDAAEVTPSAAEFLRAFDVVVSFIGGPEAEVTRRMERIRGRGVFAVDPRADESASNKHITEQWSDRLRGLGLDVSSRRAHAWESCNVADGRRRYAGAAERVVLVHPGSGGLAKCCPLEFLERAIETMRAQGWHLSWMVGPDEVERFGRSYVDRLGRSASVLFESSIEAAADLVCGADAYVGLDAGMTHVAALAGVPTVAIFGPTSPAVWAPLGPRVRVYPFPTANGWTDEWVSGLASAIDFHPLPDPSCSPKASGR